MPRDENFENPAFGVDDNGDVSVLKTDSITGKLLVSIIASSTVPTKQTPFIDDNYHTDLVVDENGATTALVSDSLGRLYITGANIT